MIIPFGMFHPPIVAGGSPLAIVSSNVSSRIANVNTATVNLPASIVAGNLLVMFFHSNGATTPNIPSGWTQIGSSITNNDTLTVLAKIASGSEGATLAMTLAAGAVGRSAHITYQISGNRNGVTTSELKLTTVSGGVGNANPNPPSNAPGWGSVQILWFAVAGMTDGSRTISSYPSGYALGQNTINGNTGYASTRVAAAGKLATATSDDPGTYTLDATDAWTAATLAIRPV